jgi:alpha-1,2-mannosyltransferase
LFEHFYIYLMPCRMHIVQAHELQLEAFALALEQLSLRNTEARLKLVGSCRHQEDEERVRSLRLKCRERGLEQNVDFCLNVPYT